MCLSTPPSSKLHWFFFKVRKHKLKLKSSKTLHKSILKLKSRTKWYCSLFSCNRVMCLYKSETHVMNYNCKWKLSADIEKKPGPCQVHVDPSKTIAAPYSQGNVCCWTMCCNELVLFDLQQQTRNQFCKWPHSNNEHLKSVVFKFA